MKKTFNENKNYYALLGVSETASKDTLDKVIGDIARNSFNGQKLSNFQEDMLAELWEAYNVLSEPTARKEYDLARKRKAKNNKTTASETPVEKVFTKESEPQAEIVEKETSESNKPNSTRDYLNFSLMGGISLQMKPMIDLNIKILLNPYSKHSLYVTRSILP